MKTLTSPSCINKVSRPWNLAQCFEVPVFQWVQSCKAIQSYWPIYPGHGGSGKNAISLMKAQQRETRLPCSGHGIHLFGLLVSGSSSWFVFVLGPWQFLSPTFIFWVKLLAKKVPCSAPALSTDCFLAHCTSARGLFLLS